MKKIVIYLLAFLVAATTSCFILSSSRERKPTVIENPNSIDNMINDKRISNAINKSKYPYTLAAIAKRETGGSFNPQTIGDKGKSYGLYQIQERHWGKFDKSIEGQTKKAEQILDELIKEHGYNKAVERYNGSGKQARAYKQDVLATVRKLRRIDSDG